jgi:hypothetical protein
MFRLSKGSLVQQVPMRKALLLPVPLPLALRRRTEALPIALAPVYRQEPSLSQSRRQ